MGTFKAENTVRISGKARWSNLVTANDDNKYGFKLCFLSEEDVAALAERGIQAKADPKEGGKGTFIGFAHQNRLNVKDLEGNPVTTELGIDTEVDVIVFPYAYSHKGKKGVSPKVQACIVTKFVEPEQGSGDEVEPENTDEVSSSVDSDEAPAL
jgi:hypothetical protein